MTRIFLITIAVLTLALMGSVRSCRQAVAKADALQQDRQALLQGVTFYRTRDSLSAASVQALTLKIGEYRQLMAGDAERIRSLGIKIRRLESVTKTATSTHFEATTTVRDTVIVRDTIRERLQTFSWRGDGASVEGEIREDSVSCSVSTTDTLIMAVHRIPRKFLFFRWGTKAVRMDIVSSNPYTSITYAQYLKFTK